MAHPHRTLRNRQLSRLELVLFRGQMNTPPPRQWIAWENMVPSLFRVETLGTHLGPTLRSELLRFAPFAELSVAHVNS